MFYQLAAVLVLAALAKAMTADWANMQVGRQVDMAVILASFLFACRPLLQLLAEIGEMILECKTFVLSFVPVFCHRDGHLRPAGGGRGVHWLFPLQRGGGGHPDHRRAVAVQ